MGLLDQLWDDTVAGPRPENGLGKLRKNSTFSGHSSSGKGSEQEGRRMGIGSPDSSELPASIAQINMIVKPPGLQYGSPPISPAGSTSPSSTFSEVENSLVLEEGQHNQMMYMRRQPRLDPGTLLLLTTCEI